MTSNTPVTQALEPCPFCGGEARRFTIGDDEPENAGGDVISCTRCGASSHVEFGRKENLVDRWNQRHRQSSSNAGGVDISQAGLFPRIVTHDEAAQAAKNFIDAHFNNEGGKGVLTGMPARSNHDDLVLTDYIKQRRAIDASLSTPTAEPMGEEQDFSRATLEANIKTILRRHRDAHPDVMLREILAVVPLRALTTPPTPDRIGKDAVREALVNAKYALEYWERESKVWSDSRVPGARPGWMYETRRRGREEIARITRALSATPAQEGED